MCLPLLELTLAGAVPLVLALGAPLGGYLAAVRALWVLHELLKNVGTVKLHDPVHVLLHRGLVHLEEFADLILGDVFPVSVFHDACTVLWDLLHNERVLLGDGRLLD